MQWARCAGPAARSRTSSTRYWMGRPSAEGPDKDYRDKYANGDTVKGKDGKIEKHDGFVDFAAQMKKVDPSILVLSCIGEIWEHAKDTSNCDGVTIHEYRVLGKAATKREMYDRWILSGDRMTKSRESTLGSGALRRMCRGRTPSLRTASR